MKVEILDRTKKKKIMKVIEENYGINDINGLFIKTGKEKIRLFTGEIGWDELNELSKSIHIEIVGAQLCTVIAEDEIRLNFDIINLPEIKKKITESLFEINEEQINTWLQGDNLEFSEEVGKSLNGQYIVIKNGKDLFGAGKHRKTYVQNYVPKERRIRR